MKVKIGNYPRWIGPYQIANWLKFFGVSDEKCDNIGKWLCDTWVEKITQWIYDKRHQKIYVRIDDFDTWNMDTTLSHIIYPSLVKFKTTRCGSMPVEDIDVPLELRTGIDGYSEEYEDCVKKWDYVLDEMIFAFEQISTGKHESDIFYDEKTKKYDTDAYNANMSRIKNGLHLFSKYYFGLWS